MLNELEQKIRKAIPELNKWEYGNGIIELPIQLNHALLYLNILGYSDYLGDFVFRWNLKYNLLSEQSDELIKFINELDV